MSTTDLPIKIRRVSGKTTKGRALLTWFQLETFPDDALVDTSTGFWWVAYKGDQPIAFAGIQPCPPNGGYLSRCGVLGSQRGQGIQKLMLDVREKQAKAQGWDAVVTTTFDNPTSSNNLIKEGYRMYTPEEPWGDSGTNYWIKHHQPTQE